MTAATLPPAVEVQRLRAELAELRSLVAAHVAADPGPVVTIDTARQWAADAARDAREEAWSAGYIAAVEDFKRSQVAAVDSAYLIALHFRDIRWPGAADVTDMPRVTWAFPRAEAA